MNNNIQSIINLGKSDKHIYNESILPPDIITMFYNEIKNAKFTNLDNEIYNNKQFKIFALCLISILMMPSYRLRQFQNHMCTIIPYFLIFLDQFIIIIYNREKIKLCLIIFTIIILIFLIEYFHIASIVRSFGTGFIKHSIYYPTKNNTELNTNKFLDYVFSIKPKRFMHYCIFFIISILLTIINKINKNIGTKLIRTLIITYLFTNVILFKARFTFALTILIFTTVYLYLRKQKEYDLTPQTKLVLEKKSCNICNKFIEIP